MAMAVSPPATPEGTRPHGLGGAGFGIRPQSMYSLTATEIPQKTRPQSALVRPPRSTSRLSMASDKAGTRLSDEDTKTSVRVVVRVRPPLRPTDPGYELIPQRFQRSTVQVPTPTSLSVESSQGRKLFVFDRVFSEDTTQNGVWAYLEDSVDSFLQGYNVSILAYGQSGAGKSYTMGTSGPSEQNDPSLKGIIPRAAQHLFESLEPLSPTHSRQNSALRTPVRYSIGSLNSALQQKSDSEAQWQMSVTYVEIYNEQPRDLLLPEGTSTQERAAVQIREDPKGRIFVEGLKSISVKSVQELMNVLTHGSSIRQTDATAINSRSSRSHAVFTINLRQVRASGNLTPKSKRMSVQSDAGAGAEGSITVESKLHFVDLAGSERLKNTGATGDRAKEGISINAGLASLGKVISQLSSRSNGGHVSYRDSKLTRMLQDSLGGNAITYMVACVTPAEFHLSETLNTVQYAQRARNIQSKPKIQQVNDEGDKQAVIERLRTEVAFLRQQIRSAEPVERRSGPANDRVGPPDHEMQNQLLDVQESYKNLSERHAKLVAHLTRQDELSEQQFDSATDTAAERLKRSEANQAQVQSIINEYEQTIQSLESSLSTTRSTLATTESTLMEKETKCAYIETMNQQLNSRVQKLMDREANTESYLHELEARLEDSTSGGEQNNAVVSELRKEMSRIRESETNAEDYISTLEERLAEADQDMEMMQRDIERLEQLVERQRSLGKLDNLLYELDNVQKAESKPKSPSPDIAGPVRSVRPNGIHNRKKSEPMEVVAEAVETEDPEDFGEPEDTGDRSLDGFQTPESGLRRDGSTPDTSTVPTVDTDPSTKMLSPAEPSPAQTQFMQDKFENVSQELFDLRLEHESTVNDLDLMAAKYQEALRTLAEMQDHLDEMRHTPAQTLSPEPVTRPQSVMEEPGQGKPGNDASTAVQRSLSAEIPEESDGERQMTPSEQDTSADRVATPSADVERLQGMLAEHEKSLGEMQKRYSTLQTEHQGTLTTLEKLRTESQRSRSPLPSSPSPGMLRRSTSQLGTQLGSSVDRGQRSIASLRSLLAEELDGKPDRMEGAEVHLTAATHEMHSRIDRIQSLETELKNTKKEMEMKSTIISGLTRERNSLKTGTPVDLSMVTQMRDQLIQKETELKNLHEGYGRREQELQNEIQEARKEFANLKELHEQTKKDLETRDTRIQTYAVELAAALASAEALKVQNAEKAQDTSDDDNGSSRAALENAHVEERNKYQELVAQLKRDLERQTDTNSSHVGRIDELTRMHEESSNEVHELSQTIQNKNSEIEQHQVRVAELKNKIKDAESAVEFHKHGLKSLHDAHANEIEEMKLSQAGLLASYDDQITELKLKQQTEGESLQPKLDEQKALVQKIMSSAQTALGHPTSPDMIQNHIADLAEEKRHVMETNKRLVSTNAELEAQLDGRQNLVELEAALEERNTKINNYQETIRSLANEVAHHEETIREAEKTIRKHEDTLTALQAENKKKINLIEELEQQLQSSYEQHHNRVSLIQQQGGQALSDAQQRIAQLERELHSSSADGDSGQRNGTTRTAPTIRPQSPQDLANRSNSITSNLRKSASIASLPSPPPAIPLPPLPTIQGNVIVPTPNLSPPQSRHASKEVSTPVSPIGGVAPTLPTIKDAQAMKRQSAIIEDQESRLRTMEKHLHAEKQLTATLEEALVDLETQSNKLRVDADSWKKKAWGLEEEMSQVRKERRSERLSVQAVEEEIKKRREAEAARAQLEERMRVLSQSMDAGGKKKKRAALNCF